MHWRARHLVPKGYVYSENVEDYEIVYVIEQVTLEDGTEIAVSKGWRSPESTMEDLKKTADFRRDDHDSWVERMTKAEQELAALR
ncbi:hypothetical protein [Pelagibius sp. Alg239-R121]|uniref:hypothetical protein n=1 Tax=Pelagibius sp. Alg239-R121 TaxID=2993448 RepID=UPI0024A6B655|nr:hypothetical protein [Pelagibius sp. Alg239-R121]